MNYLHMVPLRLDSIGVDPSYRVHIVILMDHDSMLKYLKKLFIVPVISIFLFFSIDLIFISYLLPH